MKNPEMVPLPAQAPAPIEFCRTDPCQGTVLIVEDEAELAELLEYNLRKRGYRVYCAPSGLAACRLIASQRPDLILLDILLPDIDGWEVCKMVRSHPDPGLAVTPILMMTALGALDSRLKGLQLGADAYLPKPYVMQEVLLKVQILVARGRKLAGLEAEVNSLRAGMELQADIQGMLFHEMRNQMVIVGGFSRRLARQQDHLPDGTSRAYAEAIGRSAEYLNTLAEEFLLVGNLRAGRLNLPLGSVELAETASSVAELFRPAVAVTGGVLEVAVTGVAIAHRAALRLVLSLLLDNAVKYSGAAARIRIESRSEGGRIALEVTDSGPGLDPQEFEDVFEKFRRGRASAAAKGTGLGLYIGRSLVEAMGGSLEAKVATVGACFQLVLPEWRAAAD
ncbi:MAG: response regulator [Desulfuromonadales bacterium]|nr:response regulator [Desulfuromonadales bacterium]